MAQVASLVGKALLAGCVTFTFLDRVGHPAAVTGDSMAPTLDGRPGSQDIVWLSKLHRHEPAVGCIFTFTSPRNCRETYIKRVSAVGEDIVRRPHDHQLYLIPKGMCWMLSDNPRNANDSNVFGAVSCGLVQAKATHIIWPPHRWQKL